jgi:hypothetical protein
VQAATAGLLAESEMAPNSTGAQTEASSANFIDAALCPGKRAPARYARDLTSDLLMRNPLPLREDRAQANALLRISTVVVPKAVAPNAGQPYHGAAILKFSQSNGGQLSGNYWTTQNTSGHFQLSRENQAACNHFIHERS